MNIFKFRSLVDLKSQEPIFNKLGRIDIRHLKFGTVVANWKNSKYFKRIIFNLLEKSEKNPYYNLHCFHFVLSNWQVII